MALTLSRRGKSPVRQIESKMMDGRSLQMTETVNPDGWALFVGCDVTNLGVDYRELRQARDEAIRGALTDPLTGLPNRRSMETMLDRYVGEASFRPTCVVMMNIDHFKHVNDSLGHPAGDDVLVKFARTVQPALRKADSFARIGGEEFLIFLPDLTRANAIRVVDNLRTLVREMRVPHKGKEIMITVSAGVTTIETGDAPRRVLSRCDKALYSAKHDGRDCTRVR